MFEVESITLYGVYRDSVGKGEEGGSYLTS